jgi:hypothetical protein
MNENIYQYNTPLLELDKNTEVEKLLLPNKEYSMTISYPLNRPETYRVISGVEGTRKNELGKIVMDTYKQIYREEVEDSGPPMYHPTEPRRIESSGRRGIWGHDLEDLWLIWIEIDNNLNKIKPIITAKIKYYEY